MIYTLGKVCSLDIESNGLLEDSIDFTKGFPLVLKDSSKLWCISITDAETKVTVNITHTSTSITRDWLKQVLSEYDTVILHNGVKFDLPLLSLFGVIDYKIGYSNQRDTIFDKEMNIIDTLILSRILNPSRLNGHGLKQWGIRLGNNKIDFRDKLIQLGALKSNSPKGAEFLEFHPEMIPYCDQDALLTCDVFNKLWLELLLSEHNALKIEHKLADLAVNREMFGFDFDIEGAKNCVVDLDSKLNNLRDIVNPVLPEKYLNQSELNLYTPPKNQTKKNGDISAHMLSFIKIHNLELFSDISTKKTIFTFDGNNFEIGHQDPIKSYKPGDISDIDHVKHFLIELGWVPTEWRIRDLTKTADKKTLPFDKRVTALKRYLKETYEGKYTNARCKELKIKDPSDKDEYKRVYKELYLKLRDDFPVRVITSPATKVGVSKELCPNLIALGDKVEFAKHFGLYSTYKHRRSCIADKEYFVEDSDDLVPEKGYLHSVRADGRISTPAIEIGATSNRYKHSVVANVPRASSIYGKEMRSLFRAGNEYFQLGFDFSSLENRVQGGYVISYPNGPELAVTLLAEKPFDLHTKVGIKLGISRNDAKSFNYACLPTDNTEVLTKEGWKYYNQIKEGDTVITYNVSNDSLEEDNVNKLHYFEDKEIIKMSNTRDSFESTADHRWFGKRRTGRKKRWFSTEFFTTEQITSEHNILMSAPYLKKDSNITPLEARILGWVLSDGQVVWSKYTRNKVPGLTVNIFQSQNKFYKEVEKDLNNIGYQFNTYIRKVENDNHVFQYYILPKSIRYLFDKLNIKLIDKHDVDWVKIILNMSDECRNNFLDTFYMGDGFKNNMGTKNQIRQNFGNIHDAVTLAWYLQGNRISVSCGEKTDCSIIVKHSTRYLTGQKLIKETLKPRPTFCLTTNNSTFIIRQNKKFISITGNCLYGAFINKLAAMLNKSFDETKILYEEYWNSVPALKALKEDLTQEWIRNDKKYITGIDSRRIYTRSEHSLLNYLFQSGGVIAAKYTTVFIFEELESKGYCISPFKGVPDVCSMIEYHDECQIGISKKSKIIKEVKYFNTESEAEDFKKSYTGKNQLSNIKINSDPTKGFFICLPNAVSIAIENATKRTEKVLDLQFDLSFEWDLGRDWYSCH